MKKKSLIGPQDVQSVRTIELQHVLRKYIDFPTEYEVTRVIVGCAHGTNLATLQVFKWTSLQIFTSLYPYSQYKLACNGFLSFNQAIHT